MEVLIPEKLIIYDGHCVICNASVHYIYKYDKTKSIHFADSDSEVINQLRNKYSITLNPDISVIFFSGENFYFYSDAIIEISKSLRFPFNLLRYFRFIPKTWRDSLYLFVANNRYRIFKRREACIIPDKELQKRIVN